MKINWFSPLPPAKTDIGHHTARILPFLAKDHDITLWTPQEEFDPSLEALATVRPFTARQISWRDLHRADISIYHIGNHYLFHQDIWTVAQQHPGIVVLHEPCVHHLFAGIYFCNEGDLSPYKRAIKRYYGQKALKDVDKTVKTGLSQERVEYLAQEYPLTEYAIENSLGVIVHSREAFEKIKAFNLYPVCYTPLPFTSSAPCSLEPRRYSRSNEGPYRLMLFGYIGANRRLEQFLTALSLFPDKEKFHLSIYGEMWAPQRVKGWIRSLGMEDLVTVHGFVPEAELNAALESSHLGINLRFPSMGEASSCQLRMWHYALPSLVTRVGWYSGLPEETVAFVNPDREIEDIQRQLSHFLSDPDRFARMGATGQRILREEHAVPLFVETLTSFCGDVLSQPFRQTTVQLSERIGAAAAQCFTPNQTSEAFIDSIAQKILDLTTPNSAEQP